jgi:hypothetical protein
MISRVVETLADVPNQEECKLNLRLMCFEAKESEIKKKLVQRLNTEPLQGQMTLHAKIVAATRQQPVTTRASTLAANAHPSVVLLKFGTSEDC